MTGSTELFDAIRDDDLGAVRAALEAGADPNARRPEDDLSPLRLAGRLCDPELVALLVDHGADVARDGPDALLEAAVSGHVPTLRALVEAGLDLTDPAVAAPALHEVQQSRHPEALDYLLEAGASSSLSEIAFNPVITEVMQLEVDHDALERFLAQGVDPDEATQGGETALMYAAARGHAQAVEILLAAGADPSATDEWRRNAAIWASEGHHLELAARLARTALERADPADRAVPRGTRLDEIDTPLRNARGRGYLVLVTHGFGDRGTGRLQAIGAADSRNAALEIVSNDNTHRQTRGPYLVCRRLGGAGGPERRSTDPLAHTPERVEAVPGNLLVLAHTPTTPPDVGAPIAAQRTDLVGFRGWAAIVAVFAPGEIEAASRRAAEQPGRSEVVELLEVCTCTEMFVEAHEALVWTRDAEEIVGDGKLVFPTSDSSSATPPLSPAPPDGGTGTRPVDPPESRSEARPDRAAPRADSRRAAHGFDPLSPMRVIGVGFRVFRAFPIGFIVFSALLLLSIVATGRVALYVAESQGMPLLAIHALLGIVAPAPLLAGFYVVVLGILRGEAPSFAGFFAGYRYLRQLAILGLLSAAFGALLAIPFLGPLWLLALYLEFALMYTLVMIVDRNVGAVQAIVASWRLSHATAMESAFVLIAAILTSLAGVAFFGFGILATIPIGGAMIAVAYGEVGGLKR